MKLSVVCPAYNEVEVLPLFCAQLRDVLAAVGEPYEVLLVDDGSRDGTAAWLREEAARDPHLRVIRLARNFGHQVALTAGLDHASGDAVITMDSDLQHPPELIPTLLERWREGAQIVYTERLDTAGVGPLKRLTSRLFYGLINRASATPIPLNAADFRLLDRQVVDSLQRLPERARFLRGLIAWVGYQQAVVPFRAPARAAGQTKYTFRKMLRFALDAVTSFSSLPLRLASYFGFAVSAAGAVLGLATVADYLLRPGRNEPGYTTIVCLILLIGGLQLVSLGIIGEYIARIYEEVKGRPLYLIRETVGFEQTAP
ncbi:MAG: glycosyltransferase family 2 protein [Fimbriimonadaceae bacterium]|nr:glycosyltransferase family 2 protein [Fimbriimonadaceae bacterium]